MLDSSQFLNEINHFKIRLDTLEKERYELEDKVRRLQVHLDTFCLIQMISRMSSCDLSLLSI